MFSIPKNSHLIGYLIDSETKYRIIDLLRKTDLLFEKH